MRRARRELPLSEGGVPAIEHAYIDDEATARAACPHLGDEIRLGGVHEHGAAETGLHGTDELARRETGARAIISRVIEEHARRARRLCTSAPDPEREPESQRQHLNPAAGHSNP